MVKAEACRKIKLLSIKLETGHLKQESPITSASLIFEAGHPEPVLCSNLEGWGGEDYMLRDQEGERQIYNNHISCQTVTTRRKTTVYLKIPTLSPPILFATFCSGTLLLLSH